MKKLLANKYLAGATNTSWLSFFRISVAAFCIFHFVNILPDIHDFLGSNSYILPDIVDAYAIKIAPTFYDVQNFIHRFANIDFLPIFIGTYITSLVCLMLGIGTRLAAVTAALMHLIFVMSMDFFAYGVDSFCTIALFYCAVFPVGRFGSVDNYIRRKMGKTVNEHSTISANLCLRVLQVHVCIVYFFSGLDKVLGFNWWSGESLWKAMHLCYNPYFVNVDTLGKTPVFLILGWLTIAMEMLYPLLMNIKKTRTVMLVGIIGLHLSIAIFLGLFFFATFMIILSVSAFYMPYVALKTATAKEPKKAKTPYYANPV